MNTNADPNSFVELRKQIRELDTQEFRGLVLSLTSPQKMPVAYAGYIIGKDIRVFAFDDLRSFLIIRDNGLEWVGKIYLLRAGRERSIGVARIDDVNLFERVVKDVLIEHTVKPVPPLRNADFISFRESSLLMETALGWKQAKQEQRMNPGVELFDVLVAELRRKINGYREQYGNDLVVRAFAAIEGIEGTYQIPRHYFECLPEYPLEFVPADVAVGAMWKSPIPTDDPQKPVWLVCEAIEKRSVSGIVAIRNIAEIV